MEIFSKDTNPFKSFWMGGFECADHLNSSGNRVDFLNLTAHLELIKEDYSRLKDFNIHTVREGIRWSQVEITPYEYDFSTVKMMLTIGKEFKIQQIWDICHFGFPNDLSPLHPHFTRRFVRMCEAFANFCLSEMDYDDQLIITPINEVSFLSWLGGEVGGTSPYCVRNGWEIKYALMRAYIQGVKTLKKLNSRIRILTTEPLVNIVPPAFGTEDEIREAALSHELQYQSVDMLCGRICPELGGKPEYLDILGFNFYYNNQWVLGFNSFIPWANEIPDPRWRSLSSLLTDAYQRYNKPIVLTETSHPGEDRPLWIDFIGREISKIVTTIPFWGVCLYPIIDRPDWDNLDSWHHSGLWDNFSKDIPTERILNEPYADSLLLNQIFLEHLTYNAFFKSI